MAKHTTASTAVTASSKSKPTSTSEKEMKRSAKSFISLRPSRASPGRESQKAPMRSRVSSLP